jgi:hypothetical protein
MKKIVILLAFVLLLLEGCGQNSQSFHGKYSSDANGVILYVEFHPNADAKRIDATIGVESAECTGSFEGSGEPADLTLILSPKEPGQGAENCKIQLVKDKQSSKITISENGCSSYHGMACGFAGTVTPVGEVKKAGGNDSSSVPTPPVSVSDAPKSDTRADDLQIKSEIASPPASTPEGRAVLGEENIFNKSISGLSITKNMNKGTVHIQFTFSSPGCPSCQFLLRLFDHNGAYLNNILSEEHYKLFNRDVSRAPRQVDLEYQVDLRDLRDAEIAEFGFYVEQ